MLRAKLKEWLSLVQWFLEDVENVKSLQTDRQTARRDIQRTMADQKLLMLIEVFSSGETK